MTPDDSTTRLLTFRSGGWVLLLALVLVVGIFAWAVAPAVFRTFERPPGDGRDPASYGFDLTGFTGDYDVLATATLYRDMVPVLDDPGGMSVDEVAEQRKALVPVDRVIGVALNGEARAYPIKFMNVHEIINDELGGVPIAVTYNWLCDSVRVFDRRTGSTTVTLGHSGLVWNSNMLMYDRHAPLGTIAAQPNASLWLQMTGEAMSGPLAGQALRVIPSQLVNWESWQAAQPGTTVMRPVADMEKRYKKAGPDEYFHRGKVVYPVSHPADGKMQPLNRVVIVTAGGERMVFPTGVIDQQTDEDGVWITAVGNQAVRFVFRRPGLADDKKQPPTVEVHAVDSAVLDDVLHCFWFAWHTLEPADQYVTMVEDSDS